MKAVIFSIMVIPILAIALCVVAFYALKEKFYKRFSKKEDKEKLEFLHQLLEEKGFFNKNDYDGRLKYINNKVITRLCTRLFKTGDLISYAEQQHLSISTNISEDIPYDWILCSRNHCVGFN